MSFDPSQEVPGSMEASQGSLEDSDHLQLFNQQPHA